MTLNQDYNLCSLTLSCAVPLWQHQLRGETWEGVQARIARCAKVLEENAEYLIGERKTKGKTAAAFNALAESIACLSLCPGGVKLFDQHWEMPAPWTKPLEAKKLKEVVWLKFSPKKRRRCVDERDPV